ncbi:Ethanolamine ammonia-lyase light chain [Paraglaciecola sp. T6c]|uniref:ethanolamine ammonia-lyase subunit EutC n=1 Tax=Pseudoalteromonas atlantica (strain T6c / ATCC BAA-1087) TaxID=3042615 RepID=UPI00005C750E|nr:ethanolamine ammonia-lyase subunit EutC [Paraglaciecola sp. T6c]ABG39951.1 Ethanolamine ammonia-lyase light chain [Paraglaciecola sp. T6c]
MKKYNDESSHVSNMVNSHASMTSSEVVNNPWRTLRRYTNARIGLGRAGISLPTSEMLGFQLSHAKARDAVKLRLDTEELQHKLTEFSSVLPCPPMMLHSQAFDRTTFLQRPDLGRKLNDVSRNLLLKFMTQQAGTTQPDYDLAIVVADGLSSIAVQYNVQPLLRQLITLLKHESESWRLAPLTVVEQGRVAVGDEVGEYLNAKAVLMLIGERPGLSSPDSLGLYFTWAPEIGLTDARRNCISNIRPAGLGYDDAAHRALYLLKEARRLNLSGVALKDRSDSPALNALKTNAVPKRSFLTKPS